MRIKIVRKPTEPRIDGIRLDRFTPGSYYEVGTAVGTLLLAEGWAVPIDDDTAIPPAPVTPTLDADSEPPPNLIREIFPPYFREGLTIAADRDPRTPRPRTRKRRPPHTK